MAREHLHRVQAVLGVGADLDHLGTAGGGRGQPGVLDDWVLSVTTTWPPRASTPAMTSLTKWLFPRPSGPKIPMEPELSMS